MLWIMRFIATILVTNLETLLWFPPPPPMLVWVCSQFSAPKYARFNIGKEEGAHLSENKGVKSECEKFGKNSRQMASVSTVSDEYCSSVVIY